MATSDPVIEAKYLLRQIRRQIETLKGKVDALEEKLNVISPPKKSVWAPQSKPAWRWANEAYVKVSETLPPGKRQYSDIYAAAKTDGSWRLPKTLKSFTQYVRAFRRAKGLPSHRNMR